MFAHGRTILAALLTLAVAIGMAAPGSQVDATLIGFNEPAVAPAEVLDGLGSGFQQPPTDDSMWVQLSSVTSQSSYQGVCVVGDTLYYAYQSGAVHKRDRLTGTLLSQFSASQAGTPIGIVRFGDSICVSGLGSGCAVYTLGGTYVRSFNSGMPQARGLDWDGDKFWATSYSGGALTIYTMDRGGTVLKTLTRSGGLPVTISIARDMALDRDYPNRLWSIPNTSSPYTAMYVGFDTTANTYSVLATFEHGWGGYIAPMGYYSDPVDGGCVYAKTFTQTTVQKVKVHEPVSGDDVGVMQLFNVTGLVDSGATVTPACSVYNYGTDPETYDVRLWLGDGYADTVTVTGHAVGTSEYVTFADWTPSVTGWFEVGCSTMLTDDTDPDNDAVADSVFVRSLDAGVVSLQVPSGAYAPGEIVTPTATWHNYGNATIDFEAWMLISDPTDGLVYSEKVDVMGLGAGSDIQVGTFAPCTLTTPGAWAVRCSTYLANDGNPANDLLDGAFAVGMVDAGIVSILSPGTFVDTSATVTPSARIRNNSSYPMTFDAWFILTDATDAEIYREVAAVAALAGGETRDVAWTDWPAPHAEGAYAARCSLAVSDENAGNNELGRAFTVGSRPPWGPGWEEVMPMPLLPSSKAVKRGGWLAMGPEGLIYATKGYKTGDFYRYDAFADTWTILADVQAGAEGKMPEKGCRGASDGVNSLYMTKGNNTFGFWGYDVAANTWAPLADVPAGPTGKKVKGGTDLVYVPMDDTAGYVYMLKGYKTEFWRYDPATGVWEARANAPIGVKEKWDKGSWLAYDGENTIYAHKAKYYTGANHEMWKYDIPGDSWSGPLKGMPLSGLHSGRIKSKKAKDGSAGAYFDGMIYALKGGNTQQFFMYDVAADTWTEKDTVPTYGSTGKKKRVKTGADLVHWGSGAFFALKGNKTLEMWRYVIPAAMAQPERSGVMAGTLKAGRVGIQLGPNPLVGGLATLRYSLPKAGPATVRVFDALGREVLGRSSNRGLETAPTSGVVSLDLRGLSAGIYLVKVEADGFTGTQKLVIQH